MPSSNLWCTQQWKTISQETAMARYGTIKGAATCNRCGRTIRLSLLYPYTLGSSRYATNKKDTMVRVPPHKREK